MNSIVFSNKLPAHPYFGRCRTKLRDNYFPSLTVFVGQPEAENEGDCRKPHFQLQADSCPQKLSKNYYFKTFVADQVAFLYYCTHGAQMRFQK